MKIKDKLDIVKSVFKISFRFLAHYPRTFIPFLIIAVCNTFSFFILYLAPMHPFKKILGPPIAKFFGIQYLHYPYNFLLLPELFSVAKNFLINPVISSVMIAVCVGMVYDYYSSREPSFLKNLNKALRRFLHVAACMFLMVVLTYFVFGAVTFILGKIFSGWRKVGTLSFFVSFFISIGIESLFVYTFLAIMVKRKSIFGALKESLSFSTRLYFVSYLLVFIPRLLDLGVSILQRKQLYLMDKFIPDIAILILVLGIIIAIFSDGLLYTLISHFYILKKQAQDSNDNLKVNDKDA